MARDLSRLRIEDKGEPFAGRRSSPVRAVLFAAAGFAAGLCILKTGAFGGSQSAAPLPAAEPRTRGVEPPRAAAGPAAPTLGGSLDATGYVVAQRKAAVSSKATGR